MIPDPVVNTLDEMAGLEANIGRPGRDREAGDAVEGTPPSGVQAQVPGVGTLLAGAVMFR